MHSCSDMRTTSMLGELEVFVVRPKIYSERNTQLQQCIFSTPGEKGSTAPIGWHDAMQFA